MDDLEILPQGWVEPIKFRGVGYCGTANPGISVDCRYKGRWAGGAMTITQAEVLVRHLNEAIKLAKEQSPLYENPRR